jgi:hypothetical protein
MLQEVNGDSALYRARYPDLAAYLKSPNRNAPQHNVIERNIFASSGRGVAGGAGGSAGGATVDFEYKGTATQYEFGSLLRDTNRIEKNLVARPAAAPDTVQVLFNPFGENLAKSEQVISWSAWKAQGFDAGSLLVANAGFVAPEKDDFRLLAHSPAHKIGFEPIPVEKIGLYKDLWRKSLPAPDTRKTSLTPSVVRVNVLPESLRQAPAPTASGGR